MTISKESNENKTDTNLGVMDLVAVWYLVRVLFSFLSLPIAFRVSIPIIGAVLTQTVILSNIYLPIIVLTIILANFMTLPSFANYIILRGRGKAPYLFMDDIT